MEGLVVRKSFFIDSQRGDIAMDYEVGKKLGDGAYGNVYLSKHIPSQTIRAIK